jgi:RNA polymerase sigma-70 factor (ECF subfamily)
MGPEDHEGQERRWLAACQRGDSDSCALIVRGYQDVALRTAFLITNDRQAAEDVAQNAFLNALRHLNRYDLDRPFRPWFLTILANEARMHLRGQRRKPTISLDDENHPETSDDGEALDTLLIRGDDRARVREALARLGEPFRTTVVLYYFNDLSIEEIAAATDSATGTVKSRLHRGREQLRTLLAGHQAEAQPVTDPLWRATR